MPTWEEKETDKGYWNQADKIQDTVAERINSDEKSEGYFYWVKLSYSTSQYKGSIDYLLKPLIQDRMFFKNTYTVSDSSWHAIEIMD